MMHAVVYHGAGRMSWDEVPRPVIEASTDVVVRVDAVTVCGTDLHILRGDVPEVTPGRILGHEAVGTVVAAGSGTARGIGDRVLVSCISACGSCSYCRRFGGLLSLPAWARTWSPFDHLATFPASHLDVATISATTIVAVLLTTAGSYLFTRRQID